MNAGSTLRSALFAIIGAAGALALTIAFWQTLGYRVTLPAWQIVVLPAALVGLSAGRLAGRWSAALFVIVAIFAAAVAGTGEWYRGAYAFNASLQMTATAARNDQTTAMLARMASQPLPKEALEKLKAAGVKEPEKGPAEPKTVENPASATPVTSDEKKPVLRKPPATTLWQAGLAHLRSTNPWPSWLASMLLGQIAAFWAARVAVPPVARESTPTV